MRLVNIRWTTIYQHQSRIVFRAVVKNEAIALASAPYVECEDHELSFRYVLAGMFVDFRSVNMFLLGSLCVPATSICSCWDHCAFPLRQYVPAGIIVRSRYVNMFLLGSLCVPATSICSCWDHCAFPLRQYVPAGIIVRS